MISVIVPIYKVEPYLRECIDSILAQTYADFELILVDDGSPDRCGEICDGYAEKDNRIRVIHQENAGLSGARNTGLDIAQGEYVTFVDSDDVVHPDYLSCLYEVILQNNAEIAIGRFLRFTEAAPAYVPMTATLQSVRNGREACWELFAEEAVTYTIAWGKLYKTELFAGIRYPLGRIHEDEATTYKVLYKANLVAVLEDELYYYRQNPNGIMGTSFSVKRYQALKAFQERIVFFKEHGEWELAQKGESVFPVAVAKLAIMAAEAGIKPPAQYRMPILKALRIIRKYSTDENYTYYLAKIHPNWIRPHEYLRKIKKILHIPCK